MFAAALLWSTGFLVAALGISTDQLWLVYLGYGVIGGIGLGIGYISPGLDADQVVPRPARAWPPAWRSWASVAVR